jgi:hypothetical protein
LPTVCIDFDDTLVGYKKFGTPGEWLPGAVESLRFFRKKKFTIVIHSCRAQWPEGRREIEDKLKEIGFRESSRFRIEEKPLAVAYIDDRAHAFAGDWSAIDLEAIGG